MFYVFETNVKKSYLVKFYRFKFHVPKCSFTGTQPCSVSCVFLWRPSRCRAQSYSCDGDWGDGVKTQDIWKYLLGPHRKRGQHTSYFSPLQWANISGWVVYEEQSLSSSWCWELGSPKACDRHGQHQIRTGAASQHGRETRMAGGMASAPVWVSLPLLTKPGIQAGVVAHTWNPRVLGGRGRRILHSPLVWTTCDLGRWYSKNK